MKPWCWSKRRDCMLSRRAARAAPPSSAAWVGRAGHTFRELFGQHVGATSGRWTPNDVFQKAVKTPTGHVVWRQGYFDVIGVIISLHFACLEAHGLDVNSETMVTRLTDGWCVQGIYQNLDLITLSVNKLWDLLTVKILRMFEVFCCNLVEKWGIWFPQK